MKTEEVLVGVVSLDEGRPFCELNGSGLEGWLAGVECGEGMEAGEGKIIGLCRTLGSGRRGRSDGSKRTIG